jgi:hypothetical protein
VPQNAFLTKTWALPAAEKVEIGGELQAQGPQGLKPASFCGSYGTTKVVPLRVFADSRSFSAACLAPAALFRLVINW